MATQRRNKGTKKQVDTGTVITTPSFYGSHKSMVVHTPEGVTLGHNECVCKDDVGLYVTNIKRLDDGNADPNRYGNQTKRLEVVE